MSPLPPNHLLQSESKRSLKDKTLDSKHPVIKTFTVLLSLLSKTFFPQHFKDYMQFDSILLPESYFPSLIFLSWGVPLW